MKNRGSASAPSPTRGPQLKTRPPVDEQLDGATGVDLDHGEDLLGHVEVVLGEAIKGLASAGNGRRLE